MLQTLAIAAVLIAGAGAAEPPATRPEAPAPPWLEDPVGWEGFGEDDADFAQRTAAAHVVRWREYRKLEMTPVSGDGEAFGAQLVAALNRKAVYVPEVPPAGAELREPVATTRPSEPDGPMTAALFESLAEAVGDALVVLADRPFEEQRQRYFRGRVAEVVEADAPVIEEKLRERVEAAAVTEAEAWEILRRMYEARRSAHGGGFNLRGAAIGSDRGLGCQVWYAPGRSHDDGLSLEIGNTSGTGWDDYWRAGMIVCARQFTHPPITSGELIERDGRVLRADVQVIVELNNGERAPMLLSLFFEPEEGRWWVTSACFSSSPYIAVVGQVR